MLNIPIRSKEWWNLFIFKIQMNLIPLKDQKNLVNKKRNRKHKGKVSTWSSKTQPIHSLQTKLMIITSKNHLCLWHKQNLCQSSKKEVATTINARIWDNFPLMLSKKQNYQLELLITRWIAGQKRQWEKVSMIKNWKGKGNRNKCILQIFDNFIYIDINMKNNF